MHDSQQTESLFPNSSWEEAPAKTSVWLENVLAWVENEVASSTNSVELLMNSAPNGWCGKMSLALSPATQAKTSQQCLEESPATPQLFPSEDGATQAYASAPIESQFGACLTLKTSESPSAAVACSLSQVLEPWRDELLKFCLSQKAATGILRRAENCGRTLPPRLMNALEQLAGGGLSEIAQCITARTGCRGDLETESFILETDKPLQDVVGTLAPGAHGSGASTVNGYDVPFASFDAEYSGHFNMNNNGEIAQTLKANSPGAVGTRGMKTIVRRLTPLECERLMGWPDNYTAHGISDDGEVVDIANTNRYRICGNGIVATVTEWIANRLPQEKAA